MTAVAMPTGLGAKSKRVWKGYIERYELNPGEQRILEDACRQVDLIERMERDVKGLKKLTTTGSMGQLVEHPLVKELRQHRATLAALLSKIKLPEEEPETGERSSAARAVANARWKRGA